ncbi:MAG: hypothetical protein WCC86_08075 [Methanoregula sp.]|uniref:hypothetical protein n=1 Tax=Methanoregula sp. TaxID=2052170 RepID=UPI003BB1EC11
MNGGIDNGESVTLVHLAQIAAPSVSAQVTTAPAPTNAGKPVPVASPLNPAT